MEMCPQCRTLQSMRVTESRRQVTDADGRSKSVRTRTYHCERCNTFVRREGLEESERGA